MARRFVDKWRKAMACQRHSGSARMRRDALWRAVNGNYCEEAINVARSIIECEEELPNNAMLRLLQMAVIPPSGPELFAEALNICARGGIRLDEVRFAALIGALLAREAPHAQVRCALNLGLRPDADVLPLVPNELDKEYAMRACFVGADFDDPGEPEGHDRNSSEPIDWGFDPPRILECSGFDWRGIGRLINGLYKKAGSYPEKLGNNKPVYMKPDGLVGDTGVYVYYSSSDGSAWPEGWYIGTELGGGVTYAYLSGSKGQWPPAPCKWKVKNSTGRKLKAGQGGWTKAEGGFMPPPDKGSHARILDEERAQQALYSVDLSRLRGRVEGRDAAAAEYFCHFFVLVCIEHLWELQSFRCRFRHRAASELVSFGLCFDKLEPDWGTWRESDQARGIRLPGWPDAGETKVAFILPDDINTERCSFRRGESFCVSLGHPLRSRLGEGSVVDIDFKARRIYVSMNLKLPEDPKGARRYRLDIYGNRTTYERQVGALLQFVSTEVTSRSRLCDMMIAAGVGKVDLAVLGKDGFHADKDKLAASDIDLKSCEWMSRQTGDGKNKSEPAPEPKKVTTVVSDIGQNGASAVALPSTKAACIGDAAPASSTVAGGVKQFQVWEDDEMEEVEEEVFVSEETVLEDAENVQSCLEEVANACEGTISEADLEAIVKVATELQGEDQENQGVGGGCGGGECRREGVASRDVRNDVGLPAVAVGTAEEDGGDTEERKRTGKAVEEAEAKIKTNSIADEAIEDLDPVRHQEAKDIIEQLGSVSEAQRSALLNAMSRRLTIVQGPPGTGKTHTSIRILTLWAKTMCYKPLLCTSECNIAVDNIAEGLVKNGVKVVRVGRPEKVREHLEAACLDNIVKAERAKRGQEESDDECEVPDSHEWRAKRARRRNEEHRQDQFVRTQALEEAEVIASTTITAGSQALAGKFKFHSILIDEVAQATETSAIVPIVCCGAKQLVLCGDHCQLPPSVQCREAELRGYSLSLYSRLVEAGVPFRFLDTQYRAHYMLMEFSASSIYQGKLKTGVDSSERPRPKGVPWPNPECPAAFIESSVEEHLDIESRANSAEALVVLNLVKEVLACGELGMADIGIVTPYKGQVRTLRRTLYSEIPGAQASRELEIASVDNFQGREKELIIFSAVRCNEIGNVGFLADWRRLNVMITRARRGLVVIGNAATLYMDPHWRLWLEFTEKQGGAVKGTIDAARDVCEEKGLLKRKGKGKGKGEGQREGEGKGAKEMGRKVPETEETPRKRQNTAACVDRDAITPSRPKRRRKAGAEWGPPGLVVRTGTSGRKGGVPSWKEASHLTGSDCAPKVSS